jgi:O-antigen/teichoic acid export membrane protein
LFRTQQSLNAKRFARYTLFNFLGQGLPLVVAIFCLPFLVRYLGAERFGVLALAWVVIGYFSLFDLGVGRALTKVVAEKLGEQKDEEVPPLVMNGLFIMLCLGLVAALFGVLIFPWIARNALKLPSYLEVETVESFYLLAFTLPFVILSSGLRGVLEAHFRFGAVNVIRGISGAFTFAGPLLALKFSDSLVTIVATLSVGRIVTCLVHWQLCVTTVSISRGNFSFDKPLMRALLKFGGWITVSNLIGPLMVYLDRFVIASLVAVSAVTYYVTPYEVVTRLWLIPGALMAVLFPIFAMKVQTDKLRTANFARSSAIALFVLLFPVCLLIVAFAEEGLRVWIGQDFAEKSTAILQWLTVGVLVNSVAQIPFALIQSAGRADLTAKLHIAELPVYLVLLWWLLEQYGVVGAAIAWTIRAGVDALVLIIYSRRIVPNALPPLPIFLAATVALLVLYGANYLQAALTKLAYIGVVSAFIFSMARRSLFKNGVFAISPTGPRE